MWESESDHTGRLDGNNNSGYKSIENWHERFHEFRIE